MTDPVVVIGAGYAGRVATARLARAGVSVTLVDPREQLWEKVRLHHRAVGRDQRPQRPQRLRDLFEPLGAQVVQGHAARVEAGKVWLRDGRCLRARHVALTVGATTQPSLPGQRHALTLDTPDDAAELRTHVEQHHHVLVVGSGLTAVELAGALATRTRVTLVGAQLHRSDALAQATQALTEQGVTCVSDRVLEVTADGVRLASRSVSADAVVICTGTRAPSLAAASGLVVDAHGRAIAARDLHITDWCSGAGDAVTIPSMPWLAAGCAVALPMGAHLAACIQARLAGTPAPPFQFGWGGRIIEVGHTAVHQRTHRNGQERHASTHAAWWWTKQAILSYTHWAPELERRTGLPFIGALGDPPMQLATSS